MIPKLPKKTLDSINDASKKMEELHENVDSIMKHEAKKGAQPFITNNRLDDILKSQPPKLVTYGGFFLTLLVVILTVILLFYTKAMIPPSSNLNVQVFTPTLLNGSEANKTCNPNFCQYELDYPNKQYKQFNESKYYFVMPLYIENTGKSLKKPSLNIDCDWNLLAIEAVSWNMYQEVEVKSDVLNNKVILAHSIDVSSPISVTFFFESDIPVKCKYALYSEETEPIKDEVIFDENKIIEQTIQYRKNLEKINSK